jgi:hypothetical protein
VTVPVAFVTVRWPL